MRVSSSFGSSPTLQQQVDLVVPDPVGPLRLEARPIPAADAIDLAALDRERDLGGAGVARDHVVLGARGLLVEVAVFAGGIIGRDAAELRLLGERIVERLDLRILARDADAGAVVGGAEIKHLGRVEQRFGFLVEQRTHHRTRHDRGDGGAVLGRDRADETRRPGAARARHVLRDDRRLAWNVAAHVARQCARIDVVAAAGRRPDEEIDILAGEEVGGDSRHRCEQRGRDQAGAERC